MKSHKLIIGTGKVKSRDTAPLRRYVKSGWTIFRLSRKIMALKKLHNQITFLSFQRACKSLLFLHSFTNTTVQYRSNYTCAKLIWRHVAGGGGLWPEREGREERAGQAQQQRQPQGELIRPGPRYVALDGDNGTVSRETPMNWQY